MEYAIPAGIVTYNYTYLNEVIDMIASAETPSVHLGSGIYYEGSVCVWINRVCN